MTKAEQVTLSALSQSMKKSAVVSWTEGNINDWSAWANDMRSRINMASAVIEELCKLPAEDDKPIDQEDSLKLD